MLSAALAFAASAHALDGEVLVHDPSTVIEQAGHYYVYGTGSGLPILTSDDGWTWRRACSLMTAIPGGKPGPEVLARGGNNTWAPDIIAVEEALQSAPLPVDGDLLPRDGEQVTLNGATLAPLHEVAESIRPPVARDAPVLLLRQGQDHAHFLLLRVR